MKPYAVLAGISVVLVIVGMPLISYIYLREGLSFRINALEALKQTDAESDLTKDLERSFQIIDGMVNVVINDDQVNHEIQERIYDKFKGNKYFMMHVIKAGKTFENTITVKEKHLLTTIDVDSESWIYQNDLILIDTSGQVRHTYNLDKQELTSFIQHLSVTLPVERSKKIILERGESPQ